MVSPVVTSSIMADPGRASHKGIAPSTTLPRLIGAYCRTAKYGLEFNSLVPGFTYFYISLNNEI